MMYSKIHTIEFSQFSQFTILPNHAILNSVGSVDCIVKGITGNYPKRKDLRDYFRVDYLHYASWSDDVRNLNSSLDSCNNFTVRFIGSVVKDVMVSVVREIKYYKIPS